MEEAIGSNPICSTNSPTLYASDHDSIVVQGWIVTNQTVLDGLTIDEDETVVEVPADLMQHLAADGLTGVIGHHQPPIVHVLDNGNYIVHGKQVTDPEALGAITIPDHESCVEVRRGALAALLIGG